MARSYIAVSDITGEDLGAYPTKAEALAAAAAYDTPGRKAIWTKMQSGAHLAAGAKAAATRAARREAAERAAATAAAAYAAMTPGQKAAWTKAQRAAASTRA